MARAKRRMTEHEFSSVLPWLSGISEDRRNAAKAFLVDQLTLQAVADQHGWTRQSVNDCVAVVWRKFEKYQEYERTKSGQETLMPPGWQQVTLIAPSSLIDKFRAEIAEASVNSQLENVKNEK